MNNNDVVARLTVIERKLIDLGFLVEQLRQDVLDTASDDEVDSS